MTDSESIRIQGTKRELMTLIPQIVAMRELLDTVDLEGGSSDRYEFDPDRRYHPLIRLYFREDSTFRPGTNQPKGQGQNRALGKLSFRLMSETTDTLSESNLKALGEKIKQTFGTNGGYVWRKGKELFTYADWARGYQLQMLTRSQAQAEDLVTKVLSLQGHTPIWKYLSKSENTRVGERYPETPQTKIILGEQYQVSVQRPLIEVRFTHASTRIPPLSRSKLIYDRRNRKGKALIS